MRHRPATPATDLIDAGMIERLEPRVLLAAGLFNDPISPDHPLWTAPRGGAAIDGVLDDAEWANSFEVFRTQATRNDRAVWIRMMYNDAGMFLAADVEDSSIWTDGMGGGSGNRWEVETDDSVTFYFDPDNSRDEYFQSDDRAIGVNLGSVDAALNGGGAVKRWKYVKGDGLGNAADVTPGGAMGDGIVYASSIRGTVNDPSDVDQGWSIEMFVPWAALNMPGPAHGVTVGMNFDLIQDNDGGGRNLVDNRSNADPNVRYLAPHFIDDHVQGVHSSFSATQAGIRGPINYAEVMFIDSRAGARPAAVSNLSVSAVGAFGARLNFTAPTGTTAGLGHVSGYEIRFASGPITTEAAWLEADVFGQSYTPRLATLAESLRLAELTPSREYYVVVRGVDGAGNLSDLSSNVSFTTAALPSEGYRGRLIPSPSGNTLMFENGDPFVSVGDHMGISWGFARQLFPGEVWDNANGIYQNFSTHVPGEGHYEEYFDMLGEHGVNTMRVYLELQNVYYAGNPNPPQGLNWIENNAGQFNPDMREFMHNVLRESAERGIRVIFSPFDSFSYDEAFGLEGPWATNFGGPLSDINDFFQTPGTLALAKARMSQVIAWANESEFADYVIGWEPLSEWDSYEWTLNAEGNAEPGRETEMRRRAVWMNELGAHIMAQDPGRLVFNSTIARDPRGPVARQVFASRSFDALTPHLYTNSNEAPLQNPQQDKSILPALENGYFTSYWMTHRHDNRPIINGEWGMTRSAWPGGRPEYSSQFTQAQDEASYRSVIWSGLASGQFGTGLRISTEELDWNHYLLTPGMRDLQLAFSNFVGDGSLGLDFSHFAFRTLAGRIAVQAGGSTVYSWGISDGLQGIAYLLQDANLSSGTVSGATLTMGGMARNRVFDVEIWSTDAGSTGPLAVIEGIWSPSGELIIDLPDFGRDVAVKFVAREVVSQSQTLVMLDQGQYVVTFGLGSDFQPYAYVLDTLTGLTSVQDLAAIANFRGRIADMAPFRTSDGSLHLAATDDKSHVWLFSGSAATGAWSVTDLTSGIDGAGLSGDLTTYQPSWGSIHIAGLDARGHAINYWWAPGLPEWQYTDLTEITDGPLLSGGLTGYVSGWDGLNLAGINEVGEVIVYWWAPGIEFLIGRDSWVAQNMTEQFDGPTFNGQLDAYVTPWGGLNVSGRTDSGEIFTYWWSPQLRDENVAAGLGDRWEIANITEAAGGPVMSYGTEVGVSADGGINIFAIDADRGAHMFRWVPGGLWGASDLGMVELAPEVSFPLASGASGTRLVLAARNVEDGASNLVLFSFLVDLETWSVDRTTLIAA